VQYFHDLLWLGRWTRKLRIILGHLSLGRSEALLWRHWANLKAGYVDASKAEKNVVLVYPPSNDLNSCIIKVP